jgi:hypothetical protein
MQQLLLSRRPSNLFPGREHIQLLPLLLLLLILLILLMYVPTLFLLLTTPTPTSLIPPLFGVPANERPCWPQAPTITVLSLPPTLPQHRKSEPDQNHPGLNNSIISIPTSTSNSASRPPASSSRYELRHDEHSTGGAPPSTSHPSIYTYTAHISSPPPRRRCIFFRIPLAALPCSAPSSPCPLLTPLPKHPNDGISIQKGDDVSRRPSRELHELQPAWCRPPRLI